MPTPQEYVLSFDFTSFTSQFSLLKKSFTDFGDALHKLSGQVKSDLSGIQEQTKQIHQTMFSLGLISESGFQSFERHLKSTSDYLDDYTKKSGEISQKLKDISNTDVSKIQKALAGGVGSQEDRLRDVSHDQIKPEEHAKKEEESAEKNQEEKLEKLSGELKTLEKKIEDAFKGMWEVVKKEASNAKSKATSLFSDLSGGLISGGGLIAMALGFAMLGYKEKDRQRAEFGEMLNVFEAGTSDFFSKTTRQASAWFAGFQEKAQWYYGIGRQEVQSVVKAMIDAGYTTEQIMDRFDKKLGEVGRNVVTLTLGIDKHFNLATGTSAQNVNILVEKYGDSLDVAADKYTKLSFAAQRSGMGVSKFIDSVMSGSQALTQYGIDLNDVAHVMETLKKHYQDMGLDKQYAGGQAAEALSGISQGIAGLGIGMQVVLSQRMFPQARNALEARQQFMEGWSRVAEGKDQGFLIDAVKTAVGYAKEQTGGSRDESIYFLQEQGFTFQAATAAVDIADKLEKGATIQDLSNKEMKALREAFLTEGKAVSEIQKNQRDLIKGLAELGKGIIKILSGILGSLISMFKWLITLPARLALPDEEQEKVGAVIDNTFIAQLDSMSEGLDLVISGGEKAGDAIGKTMSDVFGKGSSLRMALDADFGNRGFELLGQRLERAEARIDEAFDMINNLKTGAFGTDDERAAYEKEMEEKRKARAAKRGMASPETETASAIVNKDIPKARRLDRGKNKVTYKNAKGQRTVGGTETDEKGNVVNRDTLGRSQSTGGVGGFKSTLSASDIRKSLEKSGSLIVGKKK